MRFTGLLIFFAFLSATLIGCRGETDDIVDDGRLRVAVSIAPHAWLIEQIGGDAVRVVTVVRAGESPETFQPDDRSVTQIMRCQLYFLCGFPFEYGRQATAIRNSGRLRLVDLREGLPLTELIGHDCAEHAGGAAHGVECDGSCTAATGGTASDPFVGKDFHIWLSVGLLRHQAERIAAELSRERPGERDAFESRLAVFMERLDSLDAELRRSLAPYRDRAFLVVHPAWGYFAADYGLRQLAMHTDGKQPSDAEMTELRREVSYERITTVFVQRESGLRTAETLATSLGCRTEILPVLASDILETLRLTTRKMIESF